MDRLETMSGTDKMTLYSFTEDTVKSKLIHQENGLRTFLLMPEEGEDVIESLLSFAREKNLASSHLKGTGSLEDLVLGYPDSGFQQFHRTHLEEALEVLFFSGQVRFEHKEPDVRIRVVLGNPSGAAYGGYLLQGKVVRGPFEMLIKEMPNYLQHRSQRTGLSSFTLKGATRNGIQTKIF